MGNLKHILIAATCLLCTLSHVTCSRSMKTVAAGGNVLENNETNSETKQLLENELRDFGIKNRLTSVSENESSNNTVANVWKALIEQVAQDAKLNKQNTALLEGPSGENIKEEPTASIADNTNKERNGEPTAPREDASTNKELVDELTASLEEVPTNTELYDALTAILDDDPAKQHVNNTSTSWLNTLARVLQAVKTAADNNNTSVGNGTAPVDPFRNLETALRDLINKNTGRSNNSNALDLPGLLSVADKAMKNPFAKNAVAIVMDEIAKARAKANETNGNTTVPDFNNLLGMVDPFTVLRRLLTSQSARQLLPRAATTGHVSDQCYSDVMDTLDSLVDMNMTKKWALDMLDATGKLPGGLEKGHFYFIGSYDECYSAAPSIAKGDVIGNVLQTQGREFETRYCRADITIDDNIIKSLNVDTRGVQLKLTWGLCVPDSCHSGDIEHLLLALGSLTGRTLPIKSTYCYEDKDISEDGSAIAAIVVLSIFGALVVIGTAYDVIRGRQLTPTAISAEPKPTTTTMANGSTSNDPSVPNVYTALPALNNNDENQGQKSSQNKEFPQGYVPHKEVTTKSCYEMTVTANTTNDSVDQSKNTGSKYVMNEEPGVRREHIIGRMIRSFSIYTNVPKMLHAKASSGSVSCIHGIRFFSMTWVVLGHTYNYGIISSSETFNTVNILDFVKVIQRFTFQVVIGGGFSVDTFFLLSAFLMTWLQLKETDKKKKKLTVRDGVMFYFHRFWRLTPMYMLVIMTWACLYRYLGDGPMWPSVIESAEVCKKTWWTNLLYVNNLVDTDESCLGHAWYLANDMQFYIISPIFLAAMYMLPSVGVILTVLLLGVGVGTTLWKEYVYHGNFFTMKSDGGEYWRNVYTAPWCRVGCWAVGMLLGFIAYKRRRRQFGNKLALMLGWVSAAAVALTIVYIPYTENKDGGQPWTQVERALYEGLGRPLWGACIAWVIFACFYGGGGIVNSFLSWNGFIPLSRLTYAAYLVHPMCMMTYVFSRRTLLYIADYNIVYLFLGHLCVTYMVAFVCSLTFEAPFMALEKVLFRRGSH